MLPGWGPIYFYFSGKQEGETQMTWFVYFKRLCLNEATLSGKIPGNLMLMLTCCDDH